MSSTGSTQYDTLHHPARFSFKQLVRKQAPGIEKVVGFDFDVRSEGEGDVVGVEAPLGGVAQVILQGVPVVEVGVQVRVH